MAVTWNLEQRRILAITPQALRSLGEDLARRGVPLEEARARLLEAHRAMTGPKPAVGRLADISDEELLRAIKGAFGSTSGPALPGAFDGEGSL